VPGAGASYLVAAPANPDAVLDELVAPEPHMPYWATPWPSGLALAELVLERRERLRSRRVVELGCGLGITATAAVEAGARLLVSDCFAEALAFCQYNACRNAGQAPRTLLADWRTTAGRDALARPGPFDLVLAADVLYEAEDIAPLLDLVPRLLAPRGELWLAEPGRATSTRFVEQALAAGWSGETIERERVWPAGAGYARVRLHLLHALSRA
jgi:predicted nicotinamide N-methyase